MKDNQKTSSLAGLAMLEEEDADTKEKFSRILQFLALPKKNSDFESATDIKDIKKDTYAALREDFSDNGIEIEKDTFLNLAPVAKQRYIAVPKALEDIKE